jgi:tight adherence protein C
MLLPVVALIAGVLFFAAILVGGYAVLRSVPDLEHRLAEREHEQERPKFSLKSYLRRSEKVLKPLGEMLPRSPEEMSRQERKMVQAGIRRRDAPVIMYGVKFALAVTLFVTVIATGYWKTNPLLYSILPIFLGAFLPDVWLNRRIRNRKDNIQRALPDAMDLSVVCVEAGLGLDQSLMRIGQELRSSYPEFSEELNLYSLEVNAGKKRADAFRNLGKRSDVDDLKALVAVLIQTDRFGTSVAQSLRTFAESLRTKRRQRAEERAAKMSIKMIPPLVFFIFPSMFVVLLGPAMIAIIRYLLPGLAGGK